MLYLDLELKYLNYPCLSLLLLTFASILFLIVVVLEDKRPTMTKIVMAMVLNLGTVVVIDKDGQTIKPQCCGVTNGWSWVEHGEEGNVVGAVCDMAIIMVSKWSNGAMNVNDGEGGGGGGGDGGGGCDGDNVMSLSERKGGGSGEHRKRSWSQFGIA